MNRRKAAAGLRPATASNQTGPSVKIVLFGLRRKLSAPAAPKDRSHVGLGLLGVVFAVPKRRMSVAVICRAGQPEEIHIWDWTPKQLKLSRRGKVLTRPRRRS
jgi:hypothetical protein